MLDPYLRTLINPPLHYLGKRIANFGISANVLTLIGFFFGLMAILFIILHLFYFAIFFICLNRLFDGLDGAVARHTQLSDFGAFLDILCDFIIYSGAVFVFGLVNPENLFYTAFLIFSFVGTITSFLAYAILAAKKQINTSKRGKKSFYYLGGVCEGTETAFLMILLCLFPKFCPIICITYGILCWLTTIGRVYSTWVDFSEVAEL